MKFILFFFLLSTLSFSAPIPRRNWILEQLATPIAQPTINPTTSVFRAALNITNYSDALSGMIGALGDVGPLEIAGYASQRMYGAFTDSGKEYKEASPQDSDSIAGEIARSYATREGHFGRASAEYIYFPKNKTAFIKIGVNMGVFDTPDSPWVLKLNTHIFFRAQGDENKTYSSLVEVGQTVYQVPSARWRLGMFFGWTYKTRDEVSGLVVGDRFRNEHMLFSLGPWLEYATNYYNIRLGMPWRVWLDKETYSQLNTENKEEKIIHYPSEVKVPDLQFNFSLFL